jgi:hypothetical protein
VTQRALPSLIFKYGVMPIRADNRKYYDARWRKFRLKMLEAAGNVCQRCGKPHRLLNVAHLTHDPIDRQFLAVLCPSCHAKNDTPQRIAMTRRTRAQRRGQYWLSEEIRLAPFPVRTWPMKQLDLDLFGLGHNIAEIPGANTGER